MKKPLKHREDADGGQYPNGDRQSIRHRKHVQQTTDAQYHQAFGSLGDPDVTGKTQPFGPCLDIGHRLSGDQGDTHPDHRRVVLGNGQPESQRPQDGSVRQSVHGRVQQRAETARVVFHASHRAVQKVGEDRHGDNDESPPEFTACHQQDRSRDDAHGAQDRHGVYTYIYFHQASGQRIEQSSHGSATGRTEKLRHVTHRPGEFGTECRLRASPDTSPSAGPYDIGRPVWRGVRSRPRGALGLANRATPWPGSGAERSAGDFRQHARLMHVSGVHPRHTTTSEKRSPCPEHVTMRRPLRGFGR